MQQQGASDSRVSHATEPCVFPGVVTVGQGEESLAAQLVQTTVERLARMCQRNCVVNVVHCQLGYSALQGQSVVLW